jgi:hypothetical protein
MFSALSRVRKGKSTGMGLWSFCGLSFMADRRLRFACIVTADKGVTVNLAVCHLAQGTGYGWLEGKHGVMFIPSVLSFQIISNVSSPMSV